MSIRIDIKQYSCDIPSIKGHETKEITTSEEDKALLSEAGLTAYEIADFLNQFVVGDQEAFKKLQIPRTDEMFGSYGTFVYKVKRIVDQTATCEVESCKQTIQIRRLYELTTSKGMLGESDDPWITVTIVNLHEIIRHHNFRSINPITLANYFGLTNKGADQKE
jgi:hypothetical protein